MVSPTTDRRYGLGSGLAMKAPCRAATTAAITLSGEQTVDNVALVTGDRCLDWHNVDATKRGIYVVDTGDWVRDVDCDGARDLVTGSMVKITAGSVNGGNIAELTTTGEIIVGTTSLTFVMRSGTLGTLSAYFMTLVTAISAAAFRILFGLNRESLWCGTATGTANALVLTPTPAAVALVAGLELVFKSSAAPNSAATTIAVSGLAATAAQSNGAAMVGAEIEASKWYRATFDGAAFQVERLGPAALLSMVTAQGDVLVASAAGKLARLALGNSGQALISNGTTVAWGMPTKTDSPLLNGIIVTSRSSSAETISIKTLAGADPSAADPVYIVFRNLTANDGTYTTLSLTAAFSQVISSGSTMGATNAVAFRLWIGAFNDGGTARLGVVNCANSTSVMALRDGIRSATSEGGAGAADNAQTIYSNAAVASKAFTLLGYLDYTLAAVGTWNTAPTAIQLLTSAISLPGQVMQVVLGSTTSATSNNTGSLIDTSLTVDLPMSSAANRALLHVSQNGLQKASGANASMGLALLRAGGGIITFENNILTTGDGTQVTCAASTIFLDAPGAAGAITYKTQFINSGGSVTVQYSNAKSTIVAMEIMG